ncbi:hypothetical protein [Bradyrhizobium sp. AZCC 2289]|uniref:hypothetical protein n=1 Tax=Bradyrhizobium sp. AZCC 2289 TaxID=3117026 RepID=UPI002FF02C03
MRKIVDSNFLQDERLRDYLEASSDNFAVLTDYAAMEAYKGNTLLSIQRSMAILAAYPAQVIVLHGTQHACSLDGRGSDYWRRMIDDEQTKGFAEYCSLLPRAQNGDPKITRQLLERGREATAHMDRMLADTVTITEALDGIAATYTSGDLRRLRSGAPYTDAFIEKTLRHVMMLAAMLLGDHPTVSTFPDGKEAPDRFIFRIALCMILLALRWISVGGALKVSAPRLRNDLVDINFATFATYFDGLLTADDKLTSIYIEATIWLEKVFGTRDGGQ